MIPVDIDIAGNPDEVVRECQNVNLYTLRSVFAAFRSKNGVSRKDARGANAIYRGVSGQMRTAEFGQKQ